MKVNDVSKTNEFSSGKVKKTSSDADFASFLKNVKPTQSSPVSGVANVSSLNAIFATQMVDETEEKQRRKKLIARGKSLLDKLEEIRTALLVGHISMDRLIDISRLVKEQRIDCEDVKLKAILDEIELRVEVELAKLTN